MRFKSVLSSFILFKSIRTIRYDSFSMEVENTAGHLNLKFVVLQCQTECSSRYQQFSLVAFYHQLIKYTSKRVQQLPKLLTLFGPTYLCDSTFSIISFYNNRLRARLSVSLLCHPMHIKTSSSHPVLICYIKSRALYHISQ